MRRELAYRITEAEAQEQSVGDFLRSRGYSRSILNQLKKRPGAIRRNGGETALWERIEAGDEIAVTILEEEPSGSIQPVKGELDIVYEDEDILVINKGADTPIHPSVNNHGNTLANALMYYYQEQGIPFVYRCVNRLDRDTTGLLIVAKHMLSASILSDQVKKREIHREYRAIVKGETPLEGSIDAPIARREGSLVERCVDFEKGESARTYYRRLAYKKGYSLIALKLETGRTHQIRVHMKYLGYPLIGDYLYYPDYTLTDHQALHSYRLAFRHPITGREMEFVKEAPWKF